MKTEKLQLEITSEDVDTDGIRQIEGRFLDRPDLRFFARASQGIVWDTEIDTDLPATSLLGVTLEESGRYLGNEPAFGFKEQLPDGYNEFVHRVDLYVSPDLETLERAAVEREQSVQHAIRVLEETIEVRLLNISESEIHAALRHLSFKN